MSAVPTLSSWPICHMYHMPLLVAGWRMCGGTADVPPNFRATFSATRDIDLYPPSFALSPYLLQTKRRTRPNARWAATIVWSEHVVARVSQSAPTCRGYRSPSHCTRLLKDRVSRVLLTQEVLGWLLHAQLCSNSGSQATGWFKTVCLAIVSLKNPTYVTILNDWINAF